MPTWSRNRCNCCRIGWDGRRSTLPVVHSVGTAQLGRGVWWCVDHSACPPCVGPCCAVGCVSWPVSTVGASPSCTDYVWREMTCRLIDCGVHTCDCWVVLVLDQENQENKQTNESGPMCSVTNVVVVIGFFQCGWLLVWEWNREHGRSGMCCSVLCGRWLFVTELSPLNSHGSRVVFDIWHLPLDLSGAKKPL